MPAKPDTAKTLLRQWEMLRMIPRHPRQIPASEISSRLSDLGLIVTKRTVERDLNGLMEIFPLTVNDKSKPFGWQWARGAHPLDVPQLSSSEAMAFVLVEEHLRKLIPGSVASNLQPYFIMARKRLSEAAVGGAGPHWLDRVRVVPPTQTLIAPKVVPEVHAEITEALLKDRQLAIRYRARGATKDKEAVVHPLGLVQRGPILYLFVVFEGFTDARMLALHRISQATMLEDRATRPVGFDLEKTVRQGIFDFGSGKAIKLVARFEEDASLHLAESFLSEDQVLGKTVDGWVTVSATVMETPQLYWWLLGYGELVEVLKPASLRRQLIEAVRAMAALYRIE